MMDKKVTISYTLDQVEQVVQQLDQAMQGCAVITLTGSLGAGKTTLVRELLVLWGVTGPVTSPTYTYVNQYERKDGKKVYHFDLYRLQNLQEFEQAGFAEYLYQDDSVVLIEWPEVVMPLLKDRVAYLDLEFQGIHRRLLSGKIVC